MTISLHSMGAVFLGGTALPATNVQYSPNVAGAQLRHDDREFSSIQATLGSAPMFTFQTPIKNALDEVGLRVTKFTDIDIYLAPYTDAVHDATSKKYTLAASAVAFAVITGFSVAQGGICLANVSVACLSADGDTDPITSPANEAIPAITEPLLHTLGPVTLNGTATDGVESIDASTSQRWAPIFSDGKLYPETGQYDGGEPVISISHADPVAVLGTNYIGAAISSTTTVELRAIAAAAQTPTDTGKITLTIADGRIIPRSISAAVGGIAMGGWDIIGLSDSAQVHPWAVS